MWHNNNSYDLVENEMLSELQCYVVEPLFKVISSFFYMRLLFGIDVVICPMFGGQRRVLTPCRKVYFILVGSHDGQKSADINRGPTGFGRTESVCWK